jgi:FixJ family two-component response regulator
MTVPDHIVYVVDDDPRVREAVVEMLSSANVNAVAFDTVAEFLVQSTPGLPGCLVLDVHMPDVNGLDFQKQLSATDHVPIVFITGHGDIPMTVRAIKAGALDFLTKPFSDEDLLQVVAAAIEQDRKALQERADFAQLRARHALLTPREREVLPLIVAGFLNKQAAAELGISEITLQIHRSNAMRKMQAGSVAELVRLAAKLHISIPQRRGAKAS